MPDLHARPLSALTRRRFLQSAAATTAAGAFASPLIARSAHVGGSETLRVGVVGCGGRGTGAVLQALRADPASRLHAMADAFDAPMPNCLQRVAQALGEGAAPEKLDVADRRFAGFDGYQKVIDSGVDVVLLTTPPAFRPEHLAAAVEAGCHVFCEKPVAVDAPGVRSVLESTRRSRERGLNLVSGFCWRYKDQCRELFEELRSCRHGEVVEVSTTYNTTGWHAPRPRQDGWSEMEWRLRNWHYANWLSGDHIVEQAVHAIDWMSWALGDAPPVRCTAVGGRMTRPDASESGNVWDNFAVTYEYEGGRLGHHMCRHWPNSASDNSMRLIASRGRTHMNPWSGRPHSISGETPWKGDAAGNDMYQAEHDALFAMIREGRAINDGEWMSLSTLLAIMGRTAAYTGRSVSYEEALASEERLAPEQWAWGEAPECVVPVPGRP